MLDILRPREAAKLLGISLATLYRWVKQGRISKPIKLGGGRGGASGWREEDLDRFVKEREKES